ncbi:lysozyme inhibitor LprI family protein [Reinekea sp. G2M2-21]|uniref:lysozyme inhibitor LprI family protein n=1 Tax=Reinekea sp. G2M2-21 TaxID=2788942 RepID=UPI0018A9C164|nr:lysozyme inhibitor LprI family protein [Reinekea sp. G2M2-21]
MYRSLLIIFLVAFSLKGYASPSFNCEKASTRIEKTICNYPSLSKLDKKLSVAYKDLLNKAASNSKLELKSFQRKWIKLRDSKCNTGAVINVRYCLESEYEDAISNLERGLIILKYPIPLNSSLQLPFEDNVEIEVVLRSKDVEELSDNREVKWREPGVPAYGRYSLNYFVTSPSSSLMIFNGEYHEAGNYTDISLLSSYWIAISSEGDVAEFLILNESYMTDRLNEWFLKISNFEKERMLTKEDFMVHYVGDNTSDELYSGDIYFPSVSSTGKVFLENESVSFEY